MKSKYKTKCPGCHEFIYPGNEIIQAGSGSWVHEHCPVVDNENYQDDPLIRTHSEKAKRSLLHTKIDEDKPKKCPCGNKSFLKKRLNTIKLDDGETMRVKIFVCDRCFNVMQYVDQ